MDLRRGPPDRECGPYSRISSAYRLAYLTFERWIFMELRCVTVTCEVCMEV